MAPSHPPSAPDFLLSLAKPYPVWYNGVQRENRAHFERQPEAMIPMEACEAFLRETWPGLEDMDLPALEQALQSAQERIEDLDNQEPEMDSEGYEDWANLRENMEDLVEDVLDLLDAKSVEEGE